jgi:DNA mismatch repair protein MutL
MEITTIINGRFIRSTIISEAVVEAYKTLIPEGRYPIALIKIDIDPLLIDVNVHPSKMTIKIANEKDIARIITNRLRTLLVNNNLIPDADANLHQEGYKKQTIFDSSLEVKDEFVQPNKIDLNSNINSNELKEEFKYKVEEKEVNLNLFKEENSFSLKDLNLKMKKMLKLIL